jgi:hypothetical protein
MKTICIIAISILGFSIQAQSQCVTVGGYYAAITKGYFEKVISYSVDGDTEAIQKLMDAGVVFSLKAGVQVYLESTSWGKAEIRPKGMTETVWTNTEAVNCR